MSLVVELARRGGVKIGTVRRSFGRWDGIWRRETRWLGEHEVFLGSQWRWNR